MEPLPIVLASESSTTRIADRGLFKLSTIDGEEEDSAALRPRSRRTCEVRLVGISGVNPIVGATQQVLSARVDTSSLFVLTMLAFVVI